VRKYFLPLLFTACFLFESILLQVMPETFFASGRIMVPHLLVIALIFLTIYGNRNLGIMYGFIFGILYDVIYIEIIGIYLFALPLLCYIVSKIMKVLQTNLLIVTLVTLFGIALLEVVVYEMNFILYQTTMDFSRMAKLRLLPTILLNLLFTLILALPLKKQFEKLANQLRNQ
jgi:rod shape-determining protein MreD